MDSVKVVIEVHNDRTVTVDSPVTERLILNGILLDAFLAVNFPNVKTVPAAEPTAPAAPHGG